MCKSLTLKQSKILVPLVNQIQVAHDNTSQMSEYLSSDVNMIFTIGISGPSCSGKTTTTRILRRILPNSVVIYQDDFFKSDDQIPTDPETGLANWDCPDALDDQRLIETIQYAKTHRSLPEAFLSNESSNTHDGSSLVSNDDIQAMRQRYGITDELTKSFFVIVDGFMLYWDDMLARELDCKIFLNASYGTLKSRREARQGYVTAQGYWTDPPGYFDQIVWPQYLKWNQRLLTGAGCPESEQKTKDIVIIDTDKHSIQETANFVIEKLSSTFLVVQSKGC